MIATPRLETIAFTIEPGLVTVALARGYRVPLRFEGASNVLIDGGVTFDVWLKLFDEHGRLLARCAGAIERTVLGNRASWTHEVERDVIDLARALEYELEFSIDVRRQLAAGSIAPLPKHGPELARWITLPPDGTSDRYIALDAGVWSRTDAVMFTHMHRPTFTSCDCTTTFELQLFDADGLLRRQVSSKGSVRTALPAYAQTAVSIHRDEQRTLESYRLTARTVATGTAALAIPGVPEIPPVQ